MDKLLKPMVVVLIAVVVSSFVLLKSAQAVGVRPLVLNLDVKPGETRDFELTLTPGILEEAVNLSFYQPVQLLNGSLTYQQPDNETFSAVSWVELEDYQVQVYPGEETVVNGTVRVPFSAGGSHTVVIMVEPQAPEAQQGITFQVRYAVRLNIRIDRPGFRQTAELVEFGVEPGEEQEPIIRAVINNSSAWDYLVSGEVTIRDGDRRLVERVVLRSPAGTGSGSDATRMYPGSQVEYLGEITKRLSPGEYTMRAFFRYGDMGQIIKSETLTIAEGDFNFPSADEIGAFSVDPGALEYEVRAGERKSAVLQFASEIGEPCRIVVETQPVSQEYPYSVVDWVQLRSTSNEFELPARRNARLGLTLAVPRDAEDASYHGNIALRAYSLSDDELLSEKIVPVSVVVGTDHNYDVEVRSLYGESVDGVETVLSLDISNTGNVPLTPRGTVILTDSEGNYVERATLGLPEGESAVIPLMSQRLEGSIPELESGSYQAQITITQGNTEISVSEKTLVIE